MTWLIVLILGVVEGLTEFLPVSSTGHLILTGHWLGFEGPKAATFEIFIQSGAMLAVIILYRHRFSGLLSFGSRVGFQGWRGCQFLALTTLPALVVGAIFHGVIKTHLFTPLSVAIGLAVGGVVMIGVEYLPRNSDKTSLDAVEWKDALTVGLCQCLAIWPGVSRSASTMIGGMTRGLSRQVAAEYSFLAAVPVIGAATVYDLTKSFFLLEPGDGMWFGAGFLVSFVTAWVAIKLFIQFLGQHTLKVFGWYRLVLAGLVWWVLGLSF